MSSRYYYYVKITDNIKRFLRNTTLTGYDSIAFNVDSKKFKLVNREDVRFKNIHNGAFNGVEYKDNYTLIVEGMMLELLNEHMKGADSFES